MKKTTWIISTYSSCYEWIHTEDVYFKIQLYIKYHFRGYRVWDYPIWFANLIYKLFKKPILRGKTVVFEKYVKELDQVTYYTPYYN